MYKKIRIMVLYPFKLLAAAFFIVASPVTTIGMMADNRNKSDFYRSFKDYWVEVFDLIISIKELFKYENENQ